MATETIRLSDGAVIEVPVSRDVEGGDYYDTGAALNQAGYAELKDPGLDWFRQTGQGDFSTAEDYYKWLYGGGEVVKGPQGQEYFKTPKGVDKMVNTPLSYEKPEPSVDYGWMLPVGIATFGLASAAMGMGAEAAAGGAMDMGIGTGEVAAGFGVGPEAGAAGAATGTPSAATEVLTGTQSPSSISSAVLADSSAVPAAPSLSTQGMMPLEHTLPNSMSSTAGTGVLSNQGAIQSAMSSGASGAAEGGLIDQIIGWAKGDGVSGALINQAGGFLRGAFAPTPEEQAAALYEARTKYEMDIANWLNSQNSIKNLKLGVKPTGKFLRESNVPGLINGSLRT